MRVPLRICGNHISLGIETSKVPRTPEDALEQFTAIVRAMKNRDKNGTMKSSA